MTSQDSLTVMLERLPLLDLAIALVTVLAALRGWRYGASLQLAQLAGGLVGLVGGGALGRRLVEGGSLSLDPTLVQAGALILGALIGSAVGGRLGERGGWAVRRIGLGPADGGLGALLRGGLALLACWLVAGVLVTLGSPRVVGVISESTVLTRLNAALPSPGSIVAGAVGPQIAGLVPVGITDARIPDDARTSRAAAPALAGAVKVLGTACGAGVEGSGFAVGGGLVVTNAHVVRGVDAPTATDRVAAHPAVAVSYDPGADIALLRVESLEARTLTVRRRLASPGTQGALLGYPGDGPLQISPAVVSLRAPSVARRVGGGVGVRETYRLRAAVPPGNSGGPLVDGRGRVLGVVTARSLTDDSVGYAVASTHVRAALDALGSARETVSTGSCSG